MVTTKCKSTEAVLGVVQAELTNLSAQHQIVFTPNNPLVVAWSGGLDSTVLLHALLTLKVPVHAVHVDHQLQAVSSDWVFHCQRLAEQMNVSLHVLTVKVNEHGVQGLEGQAREARYRAILNWMMKGQWRVLACAHHQDDQLETVLVQLFRGSGLRGLAGMRVFGPVGVDRVHFPNHRVFRPLLSLSRQQLEAYATAHELQHVTDPSNQDTRYRRNWLRQTMIPELLQHFPQALHGVDRLSSWVGKHFQAVDRYTINVLVQVQDEQGLLLLKPFRALLAKDQLEVLRAWLVNHGVSCNAKQLQELNRQLLLPQGGKRQVKKGWFVMVRRCTAIFSNF